MLEREIRCHRCGERMTLYVVGDDYCRACKREVSVREAQDARRNTVKFQPKDLGPWRPAA
jgi:ribosomal protein L37E